MRCGVVFVVGALGMFAGCDGCRQRSASMIDAIDVDAADAVVVPDVLDGAPDAPAPPDAPPDAFVPYVSPACTTTPTMLIDVTPRQISNMARTGHVLYIAAQQVDPLTNMVSNGAVLSVDLMTGMELDAPFALDRPTVWSAGGEVFASDASATGTIWHMHPGAAPAAVVTGRPYPLVVTTDGTYIYWSETQGQTSVVQRQPLAGGAIQTVIASCPNARNLIVAGDLLYCNTFFNSPMYAPKDGSAAAMSITGYTTAYPIVTLIHDGTSLYFANLYNNPQLWAIPLPTGPMVKIQESATIGRYLGLAASPDYLYTVGSQGVARVRRDTYESTVIHSSVLDGSDPVLWNGQLYFAEQNPQVAGLRYVMACID